MEMQSSAAETFETHSQPSSNGRILMFLKIERTEGSLETILRLFSEAGELLHEISAKPSLDESLYFVRLTVDDSDALPSIRTKLHDLPFCRQIECENL
jgi:acetolactate synthase regulatory subunit